MLFIVSLFALFCHNTHYDRLTYAKIVVDTKIYLLDVICTNLSILSLNKKFYFFHILFKKKFLIKLNSINNLLLNNRKPLCNNCSLKTRKIRLF